MVQFVEQDPLLGLGLSALADIHQHIDRAGYLACAVAKWCRIWNEGNPSPIGAFRHGFGVTTGTPLLEGECHGALVIWKRRAVRIVKLPCDAPFIAPYRRSVARQFHGRLIEVGNLAFRVGRIDCCWRGLDQLLELPFAVAEALGR